MYIMRGREKGIQLRFLRLKGSPFTDCYPPAQWSVFFPCFQIDQPLHPAITPGFSTPYWLSVTGASLESSCRLEQTHLSACNTLPLTQEHGQFISVLDISSFSFPTKMKPINPFRRSHFDYFSLGTLSSVSWHWPRVLAFDLFQWNVHCEEGELALLVPLGTSYLKS